MSEDHMSDPIPDLAPIAVPPTAVKYWSVSVFSSRTVWFNAANFVVAALSLTEVVTLIPPHYMPMQAAIVAVINVWLRTITVRPVTFTAPGTTTAVPVPKLKPPTSSEP